MPLNPDVLRITFLTQCRASLSFDHDARLWQTKVGPYVALGKTARKSIDEAMKWTKTKGDRP